MGSGRAVFAVAVAFVAGSAWAQSAVETGFLSADAHEWVLYSRESVYSSNDHLGGIIFTLTENGLKEAKADAAFKTIVAGIKPPALQKNPGIWIPANYPSFDTIVAALRDRRPFKFSVGSQLDYQKERLIVTRVQFLAGPTSPSCAAGGTCESVIIRPERKNESAQSLRGAFVLLSLGNGVDPAAAKPSRQFVLLNDPTGHPAISNEWLDIDAFRGPLFMGEGAVITGRDDLTQRDVVYSGCRL